MYAKIAVETREEMVTIDWMRITHPGDVQEDLDNMALFNAGKITGFTMNKRYIHPDGSHVWITMTIAQTYVEDKFHRHHLAMIEDITPIREPEKNRILLEKQFYQSQKKGINRKPCRWGRPRNQQSHQRYYELCAINQR